MNHRFHTSIGDLAVVIAVALLALVTVAGPTAVAAEAWTLPRTPDGKPDLQRVWDYRTITPLERPKELGTKEFYTDLEAANFEKDEIAARIVI